MGHFCISWSAIPRRVLPIAQCARHAPGSALPALGNEIEKKGGGDLFLHLPILPRIGMKFLDFMEKMLRENCKFIPQITKLNISFFNYFRHDKEILNKCCFHNYFSHVEWITMTSMEIVVSDRFIDALPI